MIDPEEDGTDAELRGAYQAARRRAWGGDPEGALAELDRLVRAHPGEPALLVARAALRGPRGDAEGALADLARALELDASCPDAFVIRAEILQERDPEAAARDVDRALTLRPRAVRPLVLGARLAARRGDGPVSWGRLDDAARAEATEPPEFFHRGLARYALRDFPRALEDFNRAIEGGMTGPDAYAFRGMVREQQRDYPKALEDLDLAVGKAPERHDVLLSRARLRINRSDFDGASSDLEKVLEAAPGDVSALYYRALVRATREPGRSREAYAEVADAQAADPDALYFRGLAREIVDRHAEAARDYEEALKLAPADHPRRAQVEAKAAAFRRFSAVDVVRSSPISALLMAACVAVWLFQGDLFKAPDAETLVRRGASWRYLVRNGEPWRLFTAMFLHIGVVHLAWNVWAGFSWCALVERSLGSRRFALAYLLSGLGASAVSVLAQDVVSAGASGALFGMSGCWLASAYLSLGGRLSLFLNHPQIRSTLVSLVTWIVLGLTVLPMDNWAHGGGLVFGLLFGLLLLGVPRQPRLRAAAWTAALLGWTLVVVGACLPR